MLFKDTIRRTPSNDLFCGWSEVVVTFPAEPDSDVEPVSLKLPEGVDCCKLKSLCVVTDVDELYSATVDGKSDVSQ